jgi:pimeloyl-ACP methyl ester carboxylesterase
MRKLLVSSGVGGLRKHLTHDLHETTQAIESIPIDVATHLRMPTLIINGAVDAQARISVGATVAAAIRGSERAIIPCAGHLPNLERPREYCTVLESFLAARWLSGTALRVQLRSAP